MTIAGQTFTVTQQSPLQTFQTCLGDASKPTCTLPTGTYTVSSEILIGRSNVTVSGGSSDPHQTALVRDPALTQPMMRVTAATPVTGITIQSLTFCGSNTLQNSNQSLACPARVQTTCGTWTDAAAQGNPHPPLCVDLMAENADTGTNPSSPFSVSCTNPPAPPSSTGYSVTIANSDFEDATGHAIALFPTEQFGQRVNDVYIHDNWIKSSAVTGILLGSNGPTNYADRKSCDSHPNFNNDTSVSLPRNIRIEGNNTFERNNGGAIGGGARWLGLRSNHFTNNGITRAISYLDILGILVYPISRMSRQKAGNTEAELLQGTLDLIVLRIVALEPLHGYGIAQRIQQLSKDALQVRQGSLYPALYRLENRGWLKAHWKTTDGGREAKYYSLTKAGRQQLEVETASWQRLCAAISLIFQTAQQGARG